MKITIERKTSQEKKFVQFSKRCLAAMIVLWFVGALFGFVVVAMQVIRNDMTVNLSDLLMYIGAPMTGGIVSYMLKSAFENKEKIKKESENIYEYTEI